MDTDFNYDINASKHSKLKKKIICLKMCKKERCFHIL